jgi:hypothetical protein
MNTQIKTSIGRPLLRPSFILFGWRSGFLLIIFALGSLALCQKVQAVGPDTEGSIPGANNGEGVGVLVSRTAGIWNTGTGFEALNHLTAGNQNTATGVRALFSDISGGFNTATGVYSLFGNTTGFFNSATGAYSLAHNTDGSQNTANGYSALYFNIEGDENTAAGFAALYHNTSGLFNTAIGARAMFSNTDGQSNSAFGVVALTSNTTGFGNTAIGVGALFSNTEGSNNTAVGFDALLSNTTGHQNTATGWTALYHNTSGLFNTATGMNALFANSEGLSNTALGWGALLNNETGGNNTAIGVRAGQNITGNFNISIGSQVSGVAGESNTIRIGDNLPVNPGESACYIGGIYNQAVPGGFAVLVGSNGHLGTTTSSRRLKRDINPMDKASEALYALKPVSFRYKKEIDPGGMRHFGLVAEDVEKVNPDLVGRDAEGKVTAVRYDQVNAMLLNEFLKAHRKVHKLEAALQAVNARLKEQDATIQKVSAQIEIMKPAPRTALNSP